MTITTSSGNTNYGKIENWGTSCNFNEDYIGSYTESWGIDTTHWNEETQFNDWQPPCPYCGRQKMEKRNWAHDGSKEPYCYTGGYVSGFITCITGDVNYGDVNYGAIVQVGDNGEFEVMRGEHYDGMWVDLVEDREE